VDQIERTKAEIVQALYRIGWPVRSIIALTRMDGTKIGDILRDGQNLPSRSKGKRKARRNAAGHFMPGTPGGPGRPPKIPLPPKPPFFQLDGKIDPFYLYSDEEWL
jgi:hypothetical protein